jgi:ADP-ribose pyrophosphatase YjhB (NUDIX family)
MARAGRAVAGTGQVVKAMVIVRRPTDGALLVASNAGADGKVFERPLGGHVELGERAEEAVRRELLEEIAQELDDVRLLEVVENLFVLDGVPQHEIVFLFEGRLADPAGYAIERQPILDDPSGRLRVRWRGSHETSPPLVPPPVEAWVRRPTG